MPNTISQNDEKEVMRRYLFDELSTEERAGFEAHYAADRDLFEELVAFENDLVDAYARGALTESERKHFASRYLTTPQRQRRVKFAESLLDYASKSESASRLDYAEAKGTPTFRLKEWFGIQNFFRLHPWAASLAFASVVVVSICLLAVDLRLRHKLREFQAEQARMMAEKQQLAAQMKTLTEQLQNLPVHNDRNLKPGVTPPTREVEVAQLTIAPGLLRSGDRQNVLVIPRGASSARLQLKLGWREYSSYAVSLEPPEGAPIYESNGLKSQPSQVHGKKTLLVTLPADKLQDNEYYLLRLQGIASDGSIQIVDEYTFRVQWKALALPK